MMGVAGEGQKADHVDSLDLFHTMEAYFTWYPTQRSEFHHEQVPPRQVPLHRRPRPELVERYREDPEGTVTWWEPEMANSILNCHGQERSTWLELTDEERTALREHDHVSSSRWAPTRS